MEIIKINKDNRKEIIKKTAEAIKGGSLVIFPSDTVYILAVDPTNQKAVDKLLAFKNRWTGKAISVAVKNKEMAKKYVTLTGENEITYDNLLPGPFTIVSRGKHKVAKGIEAENGTLGIRIPNNSYILALCEQLNGPVTATSANLSGRTPHYSIGSFLKTLSAKKKEMIDLIVDAGVLPKNKPSTVVDATESELKILRRGDLITGKSKTLISKSEEETTKIAEFLLNKVLNEKNSKPIVFSLSGDLGCGKTVFSRGIGKALGVKSKITSPTFFIYNEYGIKGKEERFLHFDLYRINSEVELKELKFLELFEDGVVACIEWPENMGEEYLSELKKKVRMVSVNFEYIDPESREVKFDLA